MIADPSSPTGAGCGSGRASRQLLMRPAANGPQPLRVLVVDDEPSICQALSLLLSWHGIEATIALTGADACQAVVDSVFDVLLIDLRLRDARGDAIFRTAVGRDPSYADRTLFMTGDITTEAERIIADTNCPYLRKPFDITLAVQAIAALVGIAFQSVD